MCVVGMQVLGFGGKDRKTGKRCWFNLRQSDRKLVLSKRVTQASDYTMLSAQLLRSPLVPRTTEDVGMLVPKLHASKLHVSNQMCPSILPLLKVSINSGFRELPSHNEKQQPPALRGFCLFPETRFSRGGRHDCPVRPFAKDL